ncbi:MAG: site-specific integrase [Rhizobiales bacterium]|nr:site-specific integrase [Hyphomicrobiales bacterium]
MVPALLLTTHRLEGFQEILHAVPFPEGSAEETIDGGVEESHLQQREGHWAIVDMRGKAGHVRTIPVPDWVYGVLNDWTTAAGINNGSLFRRVSSAGNVWGEYVTEKLVWHVVKEFAAKIGVSKLAPHDLRRSCARLCRAAGGELEQIQFLLGHVSVQTTERYLGCTQRISSAVNDRIGIEPSR